MPQSDLRSHVRAWAERQPRLVTGAAGSTGGATAGSAAGRSLVALLTEAQGISSQWLGLGCDRWGCWMRELDVLVVFAYEVEQFGNSYKRSRGESQTRALGRLV